jgi:hypothetical protein
VVCNVKVVSDKVEDVSSLEAWRRSFIRDGMTDEQKGVAVWTSVVKFRNQDSPPVEFLAGSCVHDPRVTYTWEENGQAKQDVRVARNRKETWTVSCSARPLMKSIVLDLGE